MGSHRFIRFVAAFGLVGAMLPLGLAGPVAAAGGIVAYDAIPSTLPPNVASLGFQGEHTSEFGDYVHLAGTSRLLTSVTVTMSDWALYSDYSADPRYSGNSATWTHPITINVYSNHLTGGVPDTLLATVTQTTTIPWRPAADRTCATPTWWRASDNLCYPGIAFNASFDFSSLGVTLPNDVIVGVAFNTETFGAAPIGVTGPYISLNVGAPTGQTPSVGTDDNADDVFWNTSTASNYADGGAAGVGIFREDTGWAPNGTVAIQIAVAAPPQITKSFGSPTIPFNGSTSLSFTIDNPNKGAALTGVGFTDTLPAGLVVSTPNGRTGACGGGTITAVAGSGTVSLAGAHLAASASCTFGVNVTGTTDGVKTNSVTVNSTNGGTGNTSTASVTVLGPSDLTITKSHSGDFKVGQIDAPYKITVTNAGASPTSGTVTVTDFLPAGLTPDVIHGPGWSCNVPTLTCTRSDPLPAGASYPKITLLVIVPLQAPHHVVNVATVSGGSEVNTSNDVAQDPTTIKPHS